MAIGERFRGGGTRGIARFLADHQHCDAGFDVRREDPPGSAKLRITCEGCGESLAYNAAQAGEFAAAAVPATAENGEAAEAAPQPVDDARAPSALADAASDDPGAGPWPGDVADDAVVRRPVPASGPVWTSREPSPGRRRSRLPGWIPIALIALLMLAGGMIAGGLLRSDDGSAPAGEPGSSQPAAPPAEVAPAAPAPAGPALDRRDFSSFTIGVPAGWNASTEPDGATLTAPGDAAEVAVFIGPSDRTPLEFAELSGGFLSERHAGAELSEPRPARFEGRPAATVLVVYDGGYETTTFLSAGGLLYALIKRVDDDASARISRQASAAKQSFRPR